MQNALDMNVSISNIELNNGKSKVQIKSNQILFYFKLSHHEIIYNGGMYSC